MTIRSSSVPAPVLDGYDPPAQQAQRDRIRDQMRKLMPVSFNGQDRPRATPDESVTAVVPPPTPGQIPSMAVALSQAAEACGVDLPAMLDSQAFCAAIAKVSPSDQAELQAVIRDFTPAPAPAAMQPNPAQGASGASAPGPATGTILERMQALAEKALSQPEPPGSTFR